MSENPVQKAKLRREQVRKPYNEISEAFKKRREKEKSIKKGKTRDKLEIKKAISTFKTEYKENQGDLFFTIDNPPCEIPDQKGFENLLWEMLKQKGSAYKGELYSHWFKDVITQFNSKRKEKDRITIFTNRPMSYIADPKKRKEFMNWFKEKNNMPFYPILTNDPFDSDTIAVWGTALIAHYVKIVHAEKARHIDNPKIHPRGFFYAFLQKGFCFPSLTKNDLAIVKFEKTNSHYNAVTSYIAKARYAGLIPYEWIEDAEFKEDLETIGGYPDKRGIFVSAKVVDKALPSIKGFTSIFYVEKTGIDSIIDELSHVFPLIKVCSNKGELSVTLAHKILTKIAEEGKPAIIFMMTDYDPAGRLIAMRAVRRIQGIAVQMKAKGIVIPNIQAVFLGLDKSDIDELSRMGVNAGGISLIGKRTLKTYGKYVKGGMTVDDIFELDALWALDDPVLYLYDKIDSLLPTLVSAKFDFEIMNNETNEWYEKAKGVWDVYKDTEQGKTFSRQMGVPLEACGDTSLDSPCSIENMLDNVRQNYMKLLTESAQEFVNRINDIPITSKAVEIEQFAIDPNQEYRIIMEMPKEIDNPTMKQQYWDNYENLKKTFDEQYFGMNLSKGIMEDVHEEVISSPIDKSP